MKSVTVKIGETEFTVQEMNFGQIERVLPLAAELKRDGKFNMGTLLDIVDIMLSEAYPGASTRKMPFDLPGLQRAFVDIMGISGLELKVSTPGEAQAGAKHSTPEKSAAA